jgi:Glu/Leu/Phe/Val dehydrogenase, dimerisation domain
MDVLTQPLPHERVTVTRGRRSGETIVVAVHSTRLGPALGGCRVRHYPSWSDALADALRLSEAMTYKAALAGIAGSDRRGTRGAAARRRRRRRRAGWHLQDRTRHRDRPGGHGRHRARNRSRVLPDRPGWWQR